MGSTRWLVVVVASVFGFLGLLVGAPQEARAQSYTASESELVDQINAYRQENGLSTLSISTPLAVAAERHSEDMGTYGFFSHTTQQSSYYPVGSGHTERIAQEGYASGGYTAENLAYGQATAGEAFIAWQNSPGHNAAMLGDYSVVGVGLATVGGVPYWTAVFGSGSGQEAQDTATTDQASSNGAAPSNEPPSGGASETAQAAQYDDGSEKEGSSTPTPAVEQYDAQNAGEEPNSDRNASQAQYEAPESGSSASDQYRTAADEYRANAERLRVAADQYGAEAEALLAGQAEASLEAPAQNEVTPELQPDASAGGEVASAAEESGQHSEPSEKMASVGMTVLPDTGGLAGGRLVGGVLGAALVVCVLLPALRILR